MLAYRDSMTQRICSRMGCHRPAEVTFTYDYGDRMVAIGPLSPLPEPRAYDLCAHHAQTLVLPMGWRRVEYRHDVSA